MKNLNPLAIASAPEASRPILEQLQRQLGFVPNLMAVLAHSPAVLKAYKGVEAASAESSFNNKERQIILLTASVVNACRYCVASHSTVLKSLFRGDESVAHDIRDGQPLKDAKLNALVNFTREMVAERGFVSESTKQAFLQAGYTEVQMIEVVIGLAQKTISNYVDHLFPAPIDEAFQHAL